MIDTGQDNQRYQKTGLNYDSCAKSSVSPYDFMHLYERQIVTNMKIENLFQIHMDIHVCVYSYIHTYIATVLNKTLH